MIKITDGLARITINDHAGYALRGQDIICAGISALAQTFIASVEDLTEDTIKYRISSGYVDISYGNLSERAQVLKDSFFIGLKMMAESYPDHIKIVTKP